MSVNTYQVPTRQERQSYNKLEKPFSVLRSPFSVLRSPFSVLRSPFSYNLK
ncbi:hypothetical protein FACS1894151_09230 [Spirochaetia bacterium]|nr:hypothetical protein FACS1894151_09230 [Spirochaetia bacterium]